MHMSVLLSIRRLKFNEPCLGSKIFSEDLRRGLHWARMDNVFEPDIILNAFPNQGMV